MRKIINQPKRQGIGVLYLQIYIIFLNLAKKYLHFFTNTPPFTIQLRHFTSRKHVLIKKRTHSHNQYRYKNVF